MVKGILSRTGQITRPAALFGAVTILLILTCAYAPLPVQIGYLGILLATLLATLVSRGTRYLPEHLEAFEDPLFLAKDEQFYNFYRQTTDSLKRICVDKDPIYRSLALQRTMHLARELGEVAEGRLVFIGTETWRMTYAQLLRSPGLHLYTAHA